MIVICTNCKVQLTLNNAYLSKSDSSRFRGKCKECTKESRSEYRKEYREKTKVERSIYRKNYNLLNKESISIKKKEYCRNNRDKINEYQRSRKHIRNLKRKELYKNNILYNIEHRYRTRIQSLLRISKTSKSKRTLEYLGCTREEFLKHIEVQFLPNMNWGNRNLWDIDHIEPCCSFDLTDEEDRIKCFHYTNLRPLWSVDNQFKIKQNLCKRKK